MGLLKMKLLYTRGEAKWQSERIFFIIIISTVPNTSDDKHLLQRSLKNEKQINLYTEVASA